MEKRRTAVVSGCNSAERYNGITRMLLEAGYNVCALGHGSEKAKSLKKENYFVLPDEYRSRLRSFACDVNNPKEVRDCFSQINDFFGGIDVIYPGAGYASKYTLEEISLEDWEISMGSNVKGCFIQIKEAIKYLEKAAHPRIITIAGGEARVGSAEYGPAFAAAKGAVIGLTKSCAKELAPKGITVNCIAAGVIEGKHGVQYDQNADIINNIPLGRVGNGEDIGNAVLFFASELSDYITGAVLDVCGGMWLV